ncbi:menaquinone biosynthesis decarboxylase [Leadbettera azotonutricia]|uniref:3-octaprenyl-4-hydroxybenzoate carboxy-lyase n=1 Tax=Leadbettera azotonutricia (strain ATCC BAA-888 / DSM 13862 / ZAS-9) TaxID=545695 RepID=F5YBT8_LEAAZ|nr:menaquinone biosynthesis decarboxylase [Leadbettera azotonutricia]AEF83497.1 3-octaprenyl-4-hydroxybenzoate carboxy-lyase [Leadbettera azotonutricia ZAS-9]
MAYQSLQDFIGALEKAGELKRISVPVDPRLEITAIADRIMREGGPALLFEQVRGSAYPLAINLMGSERRMAMALNAESLDAKAREISDLIAWAWSLARDFNVFRAIPEAIPKLPTALSVIPQKKSHPLCQEVVDDIAGFDSLPVLTCWPQDGGPFLTLPLVCTEDRETGRRNMGMYRMQIYDNRTAGMHWHLHKDGAHFFQKYRERGERMPVAVALGCDPAVIYAATAPLPEGVWELLFAGFLRGKGAEFCKATLSDLLIPADAEFVLEGYVDPAESRIEGPFGDHTGFYSLQDEYPVFHLERITRRKNPVYPATIVGIPPKEDCWMAKATERLFLPLLKQLCPEIVDIAMPFEGVFHNCVIVSIQKRFPGHARKVMNFLWGMGQMMYTKCIIVVDDEVNPQNSSEVAWRAFNNVDGKRDLALSDGPLDALDHSSPLPRYGTRIGIDATRKGPDEGHTRPWPAPLVMEKSIEELVKQRWKEYGF